MRCFPKIFPSVTKENIEDDLHSHIDFEYVMKSPEDITDAIKRSKHTGDHAEIYHVLQDRRINLSK